MQYDLRRKKIAAMGGWTMRINSQESSGQTSIVTLRDACRLPIIRSAHGGKALNYATIWRWWKRGVTGAHGERVRLTVWKIGSVPVTTEENLNNFFDALGRTAVGITVRTPRQRREAIRQADAELAARRM
ncbi:MAG: hypothetical protein WCI73_09755 [Phycisphaerae bacterium]